MTEESADDKITLELLAPQPGPEPTQPTLSLAPHALTDPLVGRTLCARYRVLELVGRGGMGVVYKIEHTAIGKLLALKVLSGVLVSDATVAERFRREALLASRLTHPNSVQVFDYGTCQGLTFLVMEYVHGIDLAQLLERRGPVSLSWAIRILVQVCSSLAEAHALGIVHRDVKPANIMLAHTRDGSDFVKVLDFGLAKLRASQELNALTGGGTLVGTPNYMAPEQIMGRPVDGRTDIYAIGAIFYRLLTGSAPFGGAPATTIFQRQVEQPPEPPALRAPDRAIPDSASSIALKALEKDPARRFQRVEELQAALAGLADEAERPEFDRLLDRRQLVAHGEAITREAEVPTLEPPGAASPSLQTRIRSLATRDEVGSFQRRMLRRSRRRVVVTLVAALAAAGGGLLAYRAVDRTPAFHGAEREPNDTTGTANQVPFGVRVAGVLGRRLDADHSDVDEYRVVVPPGTWSASLRCSGVPNIPLCVSLFAPRSGAPAARICPGRPLASVELPDLEVAPGPWRIRIEQDREATSGHVVLESISDHYYLTLGPAAAAGSR